MACHSIPSNKPPPATEEPREESVKSRGDTGSHFPTLPFPLSFHFKDKDTGPKDEVNRLKSLMEQTPSLACLLLDPLASTLSSGGFCREEDIWSWRASAYEVTGGMPYRAMPLQVFKIALPAQELPLGGQGVATSWQAQPEGAPSRCGVQVLRCLFLSLCRNE